jgi:hypothetical protein
MVLTIVPATLTLADSVVKFGLGIAASPAPCGLRRGANGRAATARNSTGTCAKAGLAGAGEGSTIGGSSSPCEVIMPQMLRLTCARTTYFELELEADEGARAEDLLAAAVESDTALCERGAIGKSTYRIVDVAAAQEGEISADRRAEAA